MIDLKYHLRLFLGIFFLVSLASSVQADIKTIDIRILPEAIAYGDYYTLGDIAELDGFDIETIQKLAKIQVGKAPLPGRSRLISKSQLQNRIKNRFPEHQLKLIMPKRAMVSRAAIKITGKELKTIILAEVRKQYKKHQDISIKIKTKLRDVYIPKGNASYKISRIGDTLKIGGNSSWMLRLMLDEKEAKKILVRLKVDVFNDVVVAKGRIPKGKKIESDDLVSIKKNISKERKGYESSRNIIVGEHARRDIYKNETLNPHLVEKPVIVIKGDYMSIVYNTPNLYLTNMAMAMKSGRKGDVIPLRTLKSKKTIYAVITDAKRAEIM
ncbi:MAG: flagellar basal body P-ring formation protein FlgA [Deltaproteobacteria bacterium]|jgi:flagellar basal body P-ring formation protein FlgA|nr:flagellar basal body P-ring formation protein FlgA [Deltaproteobacteria bacterium]MBT4638611.1 flagellar basal body P-ring formation protein FlgA [Deltaproteobacteria bacterium]MBT6503526.1 flagellar basal body P-ring formation protein FlgA [Deltaproteobacteria bacterium]MBT6611598.1 flagellar basal body P-ring formation protein FlgA [Deltaproteobacteria bacterium]MBT7152281.1 flagellar basal body P-ring formation protein FlgA [Deltaproteobacteria bacterium]